MAQEGSRRLRRWIEGAPDVRRMYELRQIEFRRQLDELRIPEDVLKHQREQELLLKNQQKLLKEAIEKGGASAKGKVLVEQGLDVQRFATSTLEKIPGTSVRVNQKIAEGVGGQIDSVVSKGGKTAYVESKLTIASLDDRIVNQLTNAVKKAKTGDSVFLHVARRPKTEELAKLKEVLGDEVYSKVQIVSDQTELFSAVKAALD